MTVLVPEAERTISLAQSLCAYDSVSGKEAAIASWIAETLDPIAEIRLQEVLKGRPNVIARLETGRPGPALLFNAHIDTLPIPAGYDGDPFRAELRDDRVWGAEINNMKGALAAMMSAFATLARHRDRLCGTVTLSAVMSECDSLGLGTLALLEDGLTADFCINGEPTDLQIMTCHSGVTQMRITATGVTVHVCRMSEGRNAFNELLPALASLDVTCLTHTPHSDFQGLPTLNIGSVHGGSMASMLVDHAEALIDVRTIPGMTPETVVADIRRRIGETRTAGGTEPDVQVELLSRPQFCQQYPYQVDPEHHVVKAVAQAHKARFGQPTHVGPLYPQVFFGTDASHLARAGIPTVIYGPGKVEEINVANESMRVVDLTAAADVYCATALELCGAKACSIPV